MRPGGRDEPRTRLPAEQQFREGAIQVLVATEAAGAAITLQGVERMASVLILPHPERGASEVRGHQQLPETEMTAMRVVIEPEENRGCVVTDVHKKNVGYDITSLDPRSGELRLIEIKGLARSGGGTVLLTPNERRVAQDCRILFTIRPNSHGMR